MTLALLDRRLTVEVQLRALPVPALRRARRRRRIVGEEVRVSEDCGRGPYHLQDPVRRVLAICR